MYICFYNHLRAGSCWDENLDCQVFCDIRGYLYTNLYAHFIFSGF